MFKWFWTIFSFCAPGSCSYVAMIKILRQWFYLWKKVILNALFRMYRPWRDATHALMIHSCQLVFFWIVFTLFSMHVHQRLIVQLQLHTALYSRKEGVFFLWPEPVDTWYTSLSYRVHDELVHWDYRIALCTIVTKNSFFTLDAPVTQTKFAFYP